MTQGFHPMTEECTMNTYQMTFPCDSRNQSQYFVAGRDLRDLGKRQLRTSQVKYNCKDTRLMSSKAQARKPRPLHFPSNQLLVPQQSSQNSFRGNLHKINSRIRHRAKVRMGQWLGTDELKQVQD